jgi:hypothetical protein
MTRLAEREQLLQLLVLLLRLIFLAGYRLGRRHRHIGERCRGRQRLGQLNPSLGGPVPNRRGHLRNGVNAVIRRNQKRSGTRPAEPNDGGPDQQHLPAPPPSHRPDRIRVHSTIMVRRLPQRPRCRQLLILLERRAGAASQALLCYRFSREPHTWLGTPWLCRLFRGPRVRLQALVRDRRISTDLRIHSDLTQNG